MTNIEIQQLDISTRGDEAGTNVYYVVEDFLRSELGGGRDAGAVVVRLAVDGDHDRVQGSFGMTGDLAGLQRTVAALERVRDELVSLYDGRAHKSGMCLTYGNWGRCEAQHGHVGDHSFPTEEEFTATLDALEAARTRRARVAS